MTSIIALLAPIWKPLALALAAVFSALVYGTRQRAKGRHEQAQRAKEADHERAEDIRRRVERDDADSVRKFDGAGFRD